MSDEIKEILDRLFVYRNENDEMKYQPEDILAIEDVWLLLDYITNLQKENKTLAKQHLATINELIKTQEELEHYKAIVEGEK